MSLRVIWQSPHTQDHQQDIYFYRILSFLSVLKGVNSQGQLIALIKLNLKSILIIITPDVSCQFSHSREEICQRCLYAEHAVFCDCSNYCYQNDKLIKREAIKIITKYNIIHL